MQKPGTQICSNRYKEHKNLYRTEIIRAKQDSWNKFCSENARSSPWKVHKSCKADFARNSAPSSLTLPNGTATASAKETAKVLLQKFLPDDPIAQDTTQQRTTWTQAAGPVTPATQDEPNFKGYEADEVINSYRIRNVQGRTALIEL